MTPPDGAEEEAVDGGGGEGGGRRRCSRVSSELHGHSRTPGAQSRVRQGGGWRVAVARREEEEDTKKNNHVSGERKTLECCVDRSY